MKKELLISELIDARISAAHELIGCTDTEIAELENLIGIILPQQYKEFLRVIGNGAGKFLQGTACFLSELATQCGDKKPPIHRLSSCTSHSIG